MVSLLLSLKGAMSLLFAVCSRSRMSEIKISILVTSLLVCLNQSIYLKGLKFQCKVTQENVKQDASMLVHDQIPNAKASICLPPRPHTDKRKKEKRNIKENLQLERKKTTVSQTISTIRFMHMNKKHQNPQSVTTKSIPRSTNFYVQDSL